MAAFFYGKFLPDCSKAKRVKEGKGLNFDLEKVKLIAMKKSTKSSAKPNINQYNCKN